MEEIIKDFMESAIEMVNKSFHPKEWYIETYKEKGESIYWITVCYVTMELTRKTLSILANIEQKREE